MKKFLSLILAILMIVTTIPMAFAAEETPPTRVIDGEIYYELDSAEDYLWFVQMCNDSVNPNEPDYEYEDDYYNEPQKDYYIPYNAILTGDIVINNGVIVNGELTENVDSLINVDPIAKYYEEPKSLSYNKAYYTGTFDGNGYSISGIYMSTDDVGYAMFRRVHEEGVIKNLHIKDSYFRCKDEVSSLVGRNYGTISGCSFDGVVYADDYYAGGLVALNEGLIEDSFNAGHVYSNGHQNAGIAIHNYNGATIRNCFNIGTIGSDRSSQVGGITGSNYGDIENCYNNGELLGESKVGAISGYSQPGSKIENCYFNTDKFDGVGVSGDYTNDPDAVNIEGKTAADFENAVVCGLVGYHKYVDGICAGCGVTLVHEHTTENQTCMGYKCKYCGIYHGEADAEKHAYDNYVVSVPAKCEEKGVEKAVCIHCGIAEAERAIPEKGHDWSNADGVCATGCGMICEHSEDKLMWEEILAPVGCTPGQENAYCTVCGYDAAVKADLTTYPESSHDYPKNADITYDFSYKGAVRLTLVFSEDTFTENMWDYIYLYDGNGNEIGEYCGDVLAGAEVEIKGDRFSIRLTSDGSVCGYGFSFDAIYAYTTENDMFREIPAKHENTLVQVDAKAPTCTEIGWDAYEKCTACDYTTYEEIVALDHDIVIDEAVAPTCTETGLTEGSHCSRCDGATVAQEVVSALDHDVVIDEAVAPDCTNTGLTEGSHCSRCDGATVAQEVVSALDHDIVIDEAAVAPDCTNTGLTEGSHCSRCDGATVAQEIIPATGEHIDADGDGKCDNGGEDIACPDCGRPAHDNSFAQSLACLIVMLFNLIKTMF